MTLKKTLLAAALLSLIVQIAYARKPAVEEVMYLSIEEYKDVNPKDTKGFQFKNNISTEASRVPSATKAEELPSKIESMKSLESTDITSPILWSLIALAFPVAIWFGITLGVRRNFTDLTKLDESNVKPLHSKKKSDEDHKDLPKAS